MSVYYAQTPVSVIADDAYVLGVLLECDTNEITRTHCLVGHLIQIGRKVAHQQHTIRYSRIARYVPVWAYETHLPGDTDQQPHTIDALTLDPPLMVIRSVDIRTSQCYDVHLLTS